MLTTINAEPTLWDAILPEQCLGLPAGLASVDELLNDFSHETALRGDRLDVGKLSVFHLQNDR